MPGTLHLEHYAVSTLFFGPFAVGIMTLLTWASWTALVSGAAVLLRIAEFLMLRLASYEKGPVLALSAALLAIGLIIRPLAG